MEDTKVNIELSRRRTLGASLWRTSRTRPDGVALIDAGKGSQQTYAGLQASVERLAAWLTGRGVTSGDRVVAVLENSIEFVHLYYALAYLGAVIVPLSFRLPATQVRAIADKTGARVIVADETNAARLDREVDWESFHCLSVGVAPDSAWSTLDPAGADPIPISTLAAVASTDTFALMSTAGTTGLPKLSIKTHGEYDAAASAFLLRLSAFMDVESQITYLVTTPIFHGGGFVLLAMALAAGWRVVLLPSFDPTIFRTAVREHQPQLTWLVPTMVSACLEAGVAADELSSIRLVIAAGAPLNPTLRDRASGQWPDIVFLDVYGQTEACGPISAPRSVEEANRRPYSLGVPLLGIEMTVQSIGGRDVAPGELGEMCYRGPVVTRGYYDNPEANERAFVDGWFHSGDIGYRDEDGRVHLVDRVGDMIITGGENVFPSAVEDVLIRHPGIADCCVFGIPDDYWGERIAAAIVVENGNDVSDDELNAFCRGEMPSFMRPRDYVRVEALPKSPIGKVLRRVARDEAIPELLSAQQAARRDVSGEND